MRCAHFIVTAVLALAALGAGARGDDVSVLLEAGVYAEEVVGDLDRAIETYSKIVADAEANRRYVAEARYRLGKCYLAKGDEEQAREQFALVASRYPEQEALTRAAERELAKLQPPPAPAGELTFGPVIERVVYDDAGGPDFLIDLDTGRLFSLRDLGVPEDELGNPQVALAVVRRLGIDAGGYTATDVRALAMLDTVAVGAGPHGWDASLAEVMGRLEGLRPAPVDSMQPKATMSADGGLPAGFFFRTREGGMGILQIVGFTEDPAGVKIRYKMVQQAEPPAGPLPPDLVEKLAELSKFGYRSQTMDQLVAGLQRDLPISYVLAGQNTERAQRELRLETTTNLDRLLDAACELSGHGWRVEGGTIMVGSVEQLGPPGRLMGSVPAQVSSRLQTPVSLALSDAPLRQAAGFLARATGLRLQVVDSDLPPEVTSVTVTTETTAEHALNILCILSGYAWEAADGTVVLRPDPRPDRLPWRAWANVSARSTSPLFVDTPVRWPSGFRATGRWCAALYSSDHSLRLRMTIQRQGDKGSDAGVPELYAGSERGDSDAGVLELYARSERGGWEADQQRGPLQVLPLGELSPGEERVVVSEPLDLAALPDGLWAVLREAEPGELPTPAAPNAANLADLRIRLADAEAELTTKEAERKSTGEALARAKLMAESGRLDADSLERAQVSAIRAASEWEAAKEKVKILTDEIARLEGRYGEE